MIETASLVDQYCHGVLRTELGLGTFEAQLAGSGARPAPGTTFFDTQTGFAVRRWCAPLLGLEPHCPPARYLARRRELGVSAAAGMLLRGTGIVTYLVDTGPPGDLTGPEELAAAGGADAREIVRLERIAQRAADTCASADALLAALAEAVHAAAATAVAFMAGGDTAGAAATAADPPAPGEARAAAERWLAARAPGDEPTDPVLLRHLLWTAVAAGLPLQLSLAHTRADRLGPFAAATAGRGPALVLLGGYPYHRQAAELAHVFPHVYADLGPGPVRTGARAGTVLAEALESAPFGKLLFSSGASGLPELHVVAAAVFREALARVLGGWVSDGSWSRADAERVADLVASGNARRVYGV